jgi:peptidoglycan/LPS O-acetylase OafA/YrhL
MMDISYTLYLVHYPVLVVVTHILLPGQSFALTLIVGAVLAVISAAALSLLVERPALRWGRKLVSSAGKPRGQVLSHTKGS